MTVKACIAGTGRMGQALLSLCPADMEVIGTFGRGELPNVPPLSSIPLDTSVLIDFSHPSLSVALSEQVASSKTPWLIGTTGFTDEEFAQIKHVAKTVPVLYAPNTSQGIFVLRKLLQQVGALLPDWNININEVHHVHKKDKPSGTAKSLAAVVGLEQNKIISERAQEVFGEHTVTFASEHETLSFEHKVLSREVFAKGAFTFAKWLINKPAGYYTLDDVQVIEPHCELS